MERRPPGPAAEAEGARPEHRRECKPATRGFELLHIQADWACQHLARVAAFPT
eukprot:CAMPEP_0118949648 /NCGR_PEP_ID=MMETSP1169-20130426/50039_1 /TAXON_ID=36882 /ORGANISM="Pyramimonas obovata, Strain CCMP722" /LENGTH=52 /DNA_ID=CAMNT_0006896333 /DNA_START=460 /DNA_END=614 /DNA_ORIENTATION=-